MSAVQLDVPVPGRAYPILISPGLWQDTDALRDAVGPALSAENLIVTSERVGGLYADTLIRACRALAPDSRIDVLTLPDGEVHKTLDTVNTIITRLLEARYSRKCTLVALGGGVIGDMTGFAAAIYQRGVRFVQVPTTLLAQVDSSVGGKTGVNHPLGKNMIGAFKQPEAVLIDTDSLATLPARELSAGLAEVLKYGLIEDAGFLDWLEAAWTDLLARDPKALQQAIRRSCEIKAAVVADDETEQGRRAILNYGHTFGHAIETWTGYGEWLHGEAVATGMLMATDLSARMGRVDEALTDRVRLLLVQAGLPVIPPSGMRGTDFLELMARDKKVDAGRLRLVLLKATGHAIVTEAFSQELLEQTIADYQN